MVQTFCRKEKVSQNEDDQEYDPDVYDPEEGDYNKDVNVEEGFFK